MSGRVVAPCVAVLIRAFSSHSDLVLSDDAGEEERKKDEAASYANSAASGVMIYSVGSDKTIKQVRRQKRRYTLYRGPFRTAPSLDQGLCPGAGDRPAHRDPVRRRPLRRVQVR